MPFSCSGPLLVLLKVAACTDGDARPISQGGTNFKNALDLVWSTLSASSSSSGCNRVVLFLSDGVPQETWTGALYASTQASATVHNTHILTYALGSGADAAILKKLSCMNEGIFYPVADDANLGDVMASYYSLLSPLLQPCQAR